MPVIHGLDRFREALRGFEDSYVLIGGGACSILFSASGLDFRATHDLDVVIVSERKDAAFEGALWSFIEAGGYECGKRSDTQAAYYRFVLDKEKGGASDYPRMIELFARHPDIELAAGAHLTPLPASDDDIASLSAIILDDGYYEFLLQGAAQVDGLTVPDVLHIIPLKMRAHIDNNRLSDEGVFVSDKNRKKHRNDVVALLDLLPGSARLVLDGQLRDDAMVFLEGLRNHASERPQKDRERLLEAADFLESVYI